MDYHEIEEMRQELEKFIDKVTKHENKSLSLTLFAKKGKYSGCSIEINKQSESSK